MKNRESFLQRLRTLAPGHFSSHSALSSYGLFAPLTLWRLSVSLQPLVQALGELLRFWGSMVSRHAPIPRKGSGNQQQQQVRKHVSATTNSYFKVVVQLPNPFWGGSIWMLAFPKVSATPGTTHIQQFFFRAAL